MTSLKQVLQDKRARFLLVGCLNTVVGYGCYALFLTLGLHYVFASVLSTIIGVINSYFCNKYFTFKIKKKSAKELIRFISVYLVSYAINLALLMIFVDVLSVNEYFAGIATLFTTTIISYIGHNYFSFKAS